MVNERKIQNNEEIVGLKGLIENHINKIEELEDMISEEREGYNDKLESNTAYKEIEDQILVASEKKKHIRESLEKDPETTILKQAIKDHSSDLKDMKKTLSDLVIEYKDKTSATQLELFDGQVFNIDLKAKIIRNYK